MAETACVMHAYTFPSYEANQQRNRYEGLHDSVSFGRFATESLAWDKWSTFPNKRYVEEAAKHSQPGLVAKKKAFFEAYYKKKALLQQESENHAPDSDTEVGDLEFSESSSEPAASDSSAKNAGHVGMEDSEVDAGLPDKDSEKPSPQVEEISETKLCDYKEKSEAGWKELESSQEVSEVTITTRKMVPACPEPPSFPRASSRRSFSVKRSEANLLDRPAQDITLRNPGADTSEKLPGQIVSSSTSETDTSEKLPGPAVSSSASGTDTSEKLPGQVVSSSASGRDTSKKLPGQVVSAQAETKRTKTMLESPATGGRRSGDNWRLLSTSPDGRTQSKSPVISSPFSSRTGKVAEKKIEKLDEILNKKAVRKAQLQMKIKEKAASQLKKLRRSFCFSSGSLHEFRDESQAPKTQAKILLACFQPAKVEAESKNGCWKHVEKQRSQRQIRPGSLAEMIRQKSSKSSSDLMSQKGQS